jgi:hypothetical protein
MKTRLKAKKAVKTTFDYNRNTKFTHTTKSKMSISLLGLASVLYGLLRNLIFAASWFRIEIEIPMITGICY